MSLIPEDWFIWTPEMTKTLIREYRCHELLYNPQHPDYRSRSKRQDAYECIVYAVKHLVEGVNVDDIKKKINGLRSQYLTERTKVIKSLTDTDCCIYQPQVYWYSMLSFLGELKLTNRSVLGLDCASEIDNEPSYNSEFNLKKCKLECDKSADTDDGIALFEKFLANELRELNKACGENVVRAVKRRMQHVILEIWNEVDSTLPSSADDGTDINQMLCQKELINSVKASSTQYEKQIEISAPDKIFNETCDRSSQDCDSDNIEVVYV